VTFRAAWPSGPRDEKGETVRTEKEAQTMDRRTVCTLALASMVGMFAAGGCTLREAICSSGEYPVAAVRSTTGRACVADGQAPPAGYVRFPAGKVPKHVDDEWDRYWHEHLLDENGVEVSG
jgi:hypothetical protein